MLPRLATQRLRLGPLTPDDAAALFAYRSLAEVGRYQSFCPADLAQAQDFIAGLAAEGWGERQGWFQLGIRLAGSNDLVGDLGVHFMQAGPSQVEIGFTLAPAVQGRGLATEAVQGLLAHLFGVLGTHRVVASTDPRNTGSVSLLRRVGMRQEALFRQGLWFKGAWVDDMVFAILRDEWRAQGPRPTNIG